MSFGFAAQLADHSLDLVIRLFQQRLVLFFRHLLQAAFVCPHFVQILIFCRGRAHQGVCRKAPCILPSCILSIHSCHKIFQRIRVVQLGKAAALTASGKAILLVVDSFLTQHIPQLVVGPPFHLCFWGCFTDGLPRCFHVQHSLAGAGIRQHLVGVLDQSIQPPAVLLAQLVNAHLPTLVLSCQRSMGVLFFQCVRRFIGHLIQQVKITVLESVFDLVRSCAFHHLFQHVISHAVKRFPFGFVYRLYGLALFFQVRQLHCGLPLQLLGKFRPVFAAHFPHTHTLQCRTVDKFSFKRVLAGVIDGFFKGRQGLSVYCILHVRPRRGPCVGAIDSIGPVHHGINGIGVEHQRDGAVFGMAFLCLDHRNRRRRQPAQLQRFPQISFSQVVDGHKVLLAVHFHRYAHLEPHRFLHRFVGSLAFGGILCYTLFRDLRPAAPRIFGFHVGFAGGLFFYRLYIDYIVKNLPVICLDCGQHIRLIEILTYLNFKFSTIIGFRILVESRFPINFICNLNDFI